MSGHPLKIERLRLRHLRLLELIDSRASLRVIAEDLNTSQPALSQLLRDLEDAFATSLVHRSPRGVSLTTAGRTALHRTRQALYAIDQLDAELNEGETPILRIGMTPVMLQDSRVQSVIASLLADRLPIRFTLATGRERFMVEALEDGRIDGYLGMIDWQKMSQPLSEGLSFETFEEIPLAIACAANHPLLSEEKLDPEALVHCRWALQPVGSYHRRLLEDAFLQLGLRLPEPVIEIGGGPIALARIVAQTDLLCCIPVLEMTKDLGTRQLEPVNLNLGASNLHFVTLERNWNSWALEPFTTRLKAALMG